MEEHKHDWQIGDWLLEPLENQMSGPSGTVSLRPKEVETLVRLAKSGGLVVSRQELLSSVWSGIVVGDNSLTRSISELRTALGDDPVQPKHIQTVRQRGYRLIVPTHAVERTPRVTQPVPAVRRAAISRKASPRFLVSTVLMAIVAISTAALVRSGPPPKTHRAVPVTTYPGTEFDVALSADGERLAFSRSDGNWTDTEIYVKQIGAETAQQITDAVGIEISPAWSRDGQSLAYIRGARDCGIFVTRIPGGDEYKLAECKTFLVTGLSWSPDGRFVAFSDREDTDSPFRVYLVNVETREVTALTDPPSGVFGDFSASFSPNGNRLAFIRGTVQHTSALMLAPAVGDIHYVTLEDKSVTRLTTENAEIPHIDWTPDGQHIVFASNLDRGTSGIWQVSVDGDKPEWIMAGHGFVRKPSLAREGHRMVFEEWENDVSIRIRPLGTLTNSEVDSKPLIHSTQWDGTPQYSPDGATLAFTSKRTGASEIWLANSDGSVPIQLTRVGGGETSFPRWSADGSMLAFQSSSEGQTDIFVIRRNGGKPRRVTFDTAQDMVPSWSRDGQWIYFGSNRSGLWQVWRVPSGGGPAEQVTVDGGYMAFEAWDQDQPVVYYSMIDKPGLRRVGHDGDLEEEVVPTLWLDDWGNWAMTSRGVYFMARLPDRLIRLDIESGENEPVGPMPQLPFGMTGFSISPDHASLALVRQVNQAADIWMVEDF